MKILSVDSFETKKQEFMEFNTNFVGKNCRDTLFKSIESHHEHIREIIGEDVDTDKIILHNAQNPICGEKADNLIHKILKLIPNYPNSRKSDNDIFKTPLTPKGKKVSKDILDYGRQNLTLIDFRELESFVVELGQKWALSKTNDQTLFTRLSTLAEDFVKLGHYGPDKMSCFGGGASDKYSYAEANNTFVFLIGTKNLDEVSFLDYERKSECKNGVVVRMLGFLNKNVVNFHNQYYQKGFHSGNALEICKYQASKLLKIPCEDLNLFENKIKLQIPVYHNSCAENWSFSPSKSINEQIL